MVLEIEPVAFQVLGKHPAADLHRLLALFLKGNVTSLQPKSSKLPFVSSFSSPGSLAHIHSPLENKQNASGAEEVNERMIS